MKKILLCLFSCLAALAVSAQTALPDPLITNNGKPVASSKDWFDIRRPELREFFESNMYGRSPEKWDQIRTIVLEEDTQALNGMATRRQVRILWNGTEKGPHADVLMYMPNRVKGKIPMVVGLNFEGNHTICDDVSILIPDELAKDSQSKEIQRSFHYGQWPMYDIVKRGYGVATAWRNEVSLDNRARHMEGVRSVYPEMSEGNENWATVSAWAWGLSRIADLVLTDERVDTNRLAVIGFSRLGKASLWAGATDERFAVTISECSGAGGAKLFHRNQGEKVYNLVGVGYWFCRNFAQYVNKDTELPFDSYEMMSLIAPRALYVASATGDGYADPQGEYEALKLTSPVYQLLGFSTDLPDEFPAADTPVGAGTRQGYHVRTGKHDVTPQDWRYILNFMDKLK